MQCLVSRHRDWIRQAIRNLTSALVNDREGLYEEACYESHQAAEKAIKALLNYLNKERRGHSLLYLSSELNVSIPDYIRECVIYLDKHYIPSRYPDVYDEGIPADYYTDKDSKQCIECAKKIVDWVKDHIR